MGWVGRDVKSSDSSNLCHEQEHFSTRPGCSFMLLYMYFYFKSCNSSFMSEFGDGITRLWDPSVPSDQSVCGSQTELRVWSCLRFPLLCSFLQMRHLMCHCFDETCCCYTFVFLSTARSFHSLICNSTSTMIFLPHSSGL